MSSSAVLQPPGPLSPAVTARQPPARRPACFLGAGAAQSLPCNVLSQVSIPRALSLPSSKVVISSPVKPSGCLFKH